MMDCIYHEFDIQVMIYERYKQNTIKDPKDDVCHWIEIHLKLLSYIQYVRIVDCQLCSYPNHFEVGTKFQC